MITSYAQNFEDVMLWRALRHIEHGFYIDIGAQDPIIDSVSLAFYEQGWRGVHVEPTVAYANALRQARPDETVLQAAVGGDAAVLSLFEFPETGLSTANAEVAQGHEATGRHAQRVVVPSISLAALLDSHGDRSVHWLKIDVEGMEASVLASWAPSAVRPWVLVIESTTPGARTPTFEHWEARVLERDYRFAYFDGLNRFYVHASHAELLPAFAAPPNVFDGFVLSGTSTSSACSRLVAAMQQLREHNEALLAETHARRAALEQDAQRMEERLRTAEAAVDDRDQHLAVAKQALNASQSLAQHLEASLAAARTQLDTIQSSIWWRLAAALGRKPASPSGELEHLLRLDGEAFVRGAYETLLGRAADLDGLRHHIEGLRGGASKSDILLALAESEEGQRAHVHLPGLDRLRRKQRRFSLSKWLRRRRERTQARAIGASSASSAATSHLRDASLLTERATLFYSRISAAVSSQR